jgi:hypothetical protein
LIIPGKDCEGDICYQSKLAYQLPADKCEKAGNYKEDREAQPVRHEAASISKLIEFQAKIFYQDQRAEPALDDAARAVTIC